MPYFQLTVSAHRETVWENQSHRLAEIFLPDASTAVVNTCPMGVIVRARATAHTNLDWTEPNVHDHTNATGVLAGDPPDGSDALSHDG
jgi:hypothetical protein